MSAAKRRSAARCEKRVPNPPTPPGLTREAARSHPRYRALLKPGARCELEAGHDGPHRVPLLTWHDPPIVVIGGGPREAGS